MYKSLDEFEVALRQEQAALHGCVKVSFSLEQYQRLVASLTALCQAYPGKPGMSMLRDRLQQSQGLEPSRSGYVGLLQLALVAMLTTSPGVLFASSRRARFLAVFAEHLLPGSSWKSWVKSMHTVEAKLAALQRFPDAINQTVNHVYAVADINEVELAQKFVAQAADQYQASFRDHACQAAAQKTLQNDLYPYACQAIQNALTPVPARELRAVTPPMQP